MTDRHSRIGEVARMLGVKPHVVRYWEQEFGVRPLRSKSCQRVYNWSQLQKLLEIRRLLKVELYTIAGAKRQLRDYQRPGDAGPTGCRRSASTAPSGVSTLSPGGVGAGITEENDR